MKRFFVCGLPRSGTAWLSMLFNMVDGVFCWHEAVQHGSKFDSMEEALSGPYEAMGDCTTYTGPEFNSIEGPRAFIVRDERVCQRSFVKSMGGQALATWPTILLMAQKWRERHKPMIVNYDDIFSRNPITSFRTCESLVRHCTGKDLAYEAWLQVKDLHIQIHNLCPEHYHGKSFIRSVDSRNLVPGSDRGEGQ